MEMRRGKGGRIKGGREPDFTLLYRYIISTGDIYNFHFVKNEKMLSVSGSDTSNFSIPFNSKIKFGILYNPL